MRCFSLFFFFCPSPISLPLESWRTAQFSGHFGREPNLFSLKCVFLVSNCNVTIRIVPGLPRSGGIEGHFYHKIEMTAPEKQQVPRTHCYNVLTYLSFLIDLLCVELCFSVVRKAHPVKVRKGWGAGGKWLPQKPLWAWPWAVAPVCHIICLYISASCIPQGVCESFPLPTLGH